MYHCVGYYTSRCWNRLEHVQKCNPCSIYKSQQVFSVTLYICFNFCMLIYTLVSLVAFNGVNKSQLCS